MNNKMVAKVELCTICHKNECSKATFRDIALAMRFDYILSEYTSLSDAWRVYQGVALYREYRGIGGETKQLDVEPRPCQLCLVKIVNMAQSIFVVTSTVETKEATTKEVAVEVKPEDLLSPPAPSSQLTTKVKINLNSSLPGSILAKERWSIDSKEKWTTTPVKKPEDSQVNGHNFSSKSQTATNQVVIKPAAKISVNKNRRESPLTKSKEGLGVSVRSLEELCPPKGLTDSKPSLSVSSISQTPIKTNSRPKRTVRSLTDRNPDFHIDIFRGESSENDSVEGFPCFTPICEKKEKKQNNNIIKDAENVHIDGTIDVPPTSKPTPPFEPRPKRSGGRSLFERNPDFALDIPFAKIVEQNWKAKNQSISSPCFKKTKLSQKEHFDKEMAETDKKCLFNKVDVSTEGFVTIKTEVEDMNEELMENWRSEAFRADHLAKLDHALSSAGWSQAIRSGKNMEKEVFKNSKTEVEYVAGINRLVAHFNRGNSAVRTTVGGKEPVKTPPDTKTCVPQQALSPEKIIKPGNEKLKTSITKMQVAASSEIVPVLKEKRVVKPTKKILEKKLDGEMLKGVKKVNKTQWSRTKMNCPMCGQPQLKTKLKEHMLIFHKSSPQFPCIDCDFKSSIKVDLENHIKTAHQDLNPEGSVSESEGSVSSNSVSSTSEARGRANAVRSQFQYILKTSKTGKQGRKYIEVASDQNENKSYEPEVGTSELISDNVQRNKGKKMVVARKVSTPGSHIPDQIENDDVEDIEPSELLQFRKEDERSRQHEVLHEAAVSEKVADEFLGSSSDSEFSEPQRPIVGTLNAYYMNKSTQDEDAAAATDLLVTSVASVSVAHKERPQRRKRSIEDIHPDFVMDIPRSSAPKCDKNSKKGKGDNEESEVLNVAKNWFEVNQGEQF